MYAMEYTLNHFSTIAIFFYSHLIISGLYYYISYYIYYMYGIAWLLIHNQMYNNYYKFYSILIL